MTTDAFHSSDFNRKLKIFHKASQKSYPLRIIFFQKLLKAITVCKILLINCPIIHTQLCYVLV